MDSFLFFTHQEKEAFKQEAFKQEAFKQEAFKQKAFKHETCVTNMCHNDKLSSSLISFAEINQMLLKFFFFHILLTFMYLATLYQKTEL